MASNQLRSMTGMATLSGQTDTHNWTWELRSVNGRGLDIRVRLPGHTEMLETGIRKAISRVCSRGRVSIALNIDHNQGDAGFRLNRADLDTVLDATRMIADAARERGISLTPDCPSGILAVAIAPQNGRGSGSDLSALISILDKEIAGIVGLWNESRMSEGRLIGDILDKQVGSIESLLADAEGIVLEGQSGATARFRENVAKLLDAKKRSG